MRILRIHGADAAWGGAEGYLSSVTGMLDQEGHETRILTLREGSGGTRLPHEQTFPLPPMNLTRIEREITPYQNALTFLQENLDDFSPDLVHLHNCFNQAVVTVAKFLSDVEVPVVMTGHDATLVCPIATLLRPGNIVCEGGIMPRCLFTGCEVGYGGPLMIWRREIFDRWAKPVIRAYLCPSKALASAYDTNGYRPTIHLPSFASIPPAIREAPPTRIREGVPRVGFLGRIESYKGVDDLLSAASRLLSTGRKLVVDIAGNGPDQGRLEQRASDLGIEGSVHWSGRVAGEEKERWFRSLDCLVVPSRTFENFPLVALEALVREVPVVATRIGGIGDIVRDGKTGRTVAFAQPDSLAGGIAEVLDHPERASAWARAGRRMVLSEFTPEIHLQRLLAVYDRLLAQDRA